MGLLRTMLGWIGLQPKAATGYRSIRVVMRDGKLATHGSGDSHAKYDRPHLHALSREYFRDNAIYRGIISRFAGYIVGNGFGVQAKTSNPKWNTRAERVWKRFWRRPEVRQTLSGRGLEKMVAQEMLLQGDVAIIKAKDRGLLQLIEAEQIVGRYPTDDGIERDAAGAPVRYFVSPYGISGAPDTSKAAPIEPGDMLFLVNPERPTSTRGVPATQAAFSILKRIMDVCDSEVQAWQILSRMAVAITRKDGPLAGYNESVQDTTKTDTDGDVAKRMQVFDDCVIFHGEQGDEIKGIERNVPGQNFTESLTTFLRLLGLPLGLPLEVVMLDWTKTNYSQSRAIIEQIVAVIAEWQGILEEFFHRPAYEWVITRAMEAGDLPMNDEWDAHEWIKPSHPWIDQLKEAEAHGLQVDRGFTTHAAVVKSKGQDRDEVVGQIDKEVRAAIEMAKKIETDTGVKVHWEIFCGRMAQAPAPPPPAGTEAPKPDPAEKKESEEEARAA